MWITDIAFGYAGLALFIGYIGFARKYTTHLVRYAQIASVTAIVTDKTIKGSMMLYGFKMLFSRFGTVSMIYFSDRLISAALREVSEWILEHGDFIPSFLKSGFLSKLFSSTLRTVIFSVGEIVVSYMYNNKDLSFWEGISDGISLYVRSWKSILKAAFFSVLWLKVFAFFINISLFVFLVWYSWGLGVVTLFWYLILYRIIIMILNATFVEPYQSISMVLGFYENKKDKQDIANLSDTLQGVSSAFKDMLIHRKQFDPSIVSGLTGIVTSNLNASDVIQNPLDKVNSILRGGNKHNGENEQV